MSVKGQGVDANAIARNTFLELHMILIPETCSPIPPKFCGVPIIRASFLRLQDSSCLIFPTDTPIVNSCIPFASGTKQESLPPPPITVGALLVYTGCELGDDPAPLYVLFSVKLLLSTVLLSLPELVLKDELSPISALACAEKRISITMYLHIALPMLV